MTVRDRRAVLRGGAVVLAALVLLRALPWAVRSVAALRVRALEQQATLARAEEVLARELAIHDSLTQVLGQIVALAPRLVDGHTSAQAQAGLASLVSLAVSPTVFMLIVVAILLVLGMLMDAVPIMIALAPLLAPIARQFGISDIQFGLVFVVTCLIGLVTPPVGIILFMTSSIAGVKLEPLSMAVFPFVVWMTAVVILMVFFPPLTLWLPKLVGL